MPGAQISALLWLKIFIKLVWVASSALITYTVGLETHIRALFQPVRGKVINEEEKRTWDHDIKEEETN